MPSNNRNCCCTKFNKAEVSETISRIGNSLNDSHGLWVPENLYGNAGAYTTGHYFRDNQNCCYGPVITDQMTASGARTADEVPTGGLSYSTNISQLNFVNDSKSGTVNLANCEDCLRYHITHKNTKDDAGGGQRYGRLYAILAQCDCNDYFQFNQDDHSDSNIFERFAWPTCEIEQDTPAGNPYTTTHDTCPTGRTREDEENFDYKSYDESSATVQDGIPDDMGNTYFYLDYTPLLEEVRDSNHPHYINPNAAQTGTDYNTPSHALAAPGDGTTREVPNSTLLTAGKITFASDSTSKQNFNQQYGGSESRVPLNFCSGANRASNYFKFGSGFNGTNTGEFTITAGGETKTYKLKNTGSPNAANQEFLGVTSAPQTAINFKTIVESANGHGLDKVMVELHGEGVYITKTTPGEAENNTSTANAAFKTACDVDPLASFVGGTNKSDNMTQTGDNKGTFVVMKIDPAIDGAYNTNRAVYRAFKVIGFSQFPPTVGSSYTGTQGAIKELKLGHVDEIHFRMNPHGSTVYYGTESAIAEANGSSCYNASASNANTAQLGTGTILSGLNTGNTTDNTKWQGGNPCTRTNAATGSQGAELKLEDYSDFCKTSEYLPETITIVREFDLTDADNPWANAAVSDSRFEDCLSSAEVFSNWDDSGQKIAKTTVAEGISGPPWGAPEEVGLSGEEDASDKLRLVFTYIRNTKASCNLVDALPLSFGTVNRNKDYAFECPKENNGVGTRLSINPNDTENYVSHYELSSIQDNQGGVIHWVTDPAVFLEDTQENTANASILLDRRYLEDSNDVVGGTGEGSRNGDSTIEELFKKNKFSNTGNVIDVAEHAKQNNHRASACMITPENNSSTTPYIPRPYENSNGSYYVYGGYQYGLGGSIQVGTQIQCKEDVGANVSIYQGDYEQSTFGGLSFADLTDSNDDANTEVVLNNESGKTLACTASEVQDGLDRPSSLDPVDSQNRFYGRTAYTGLGIPSYAPVHYNYTANAASGKIEAKFDVYSSNGKYNFSTDIEDGGRGQNFGGHTFMPTFTIGIKHTAKDTKTGKQFLKASGTGNGTREELNGENFNRFRYECSTYVIPAGLYLFRIEEADKCSDDSGGGGNNLNTDSAQNRCVFGISMPIPESVHTAHRQNTSNRIPPRYLQWWEGFYRSYAQPGVNAFADSLGNTDAITKRPLSCLGGASSILQGSMEWRECTEGIFSGFRNKTLFKICECAEAKLANASQFFPLNSLCTSYNNDGNGVDQGTCECGKEDCSSGGANCTNDDGGGPGGVNDNAFGACCDGSNNFECLYVNSKSGDPSEWPGNITTKRLGLQNSQPSFIYDIPEASLISCKEAVVIKMMESGDYQNQDIIDTWNSTQYSGQGDNWGDFGAEVAWEVCCLCESFNDLGDDIVCPRQGFGGGDGTTCAGPITCCGNRAGCSVNGRYWGPEVLPNDANWSNVLDRFEIRSGVSPPRIRSSFVLTPSGLSGRDGWEQAPRNTDASPTGAVEEIKGSNFGSSARSRRLFYPPNHDASNQVNASNQNCDLRFIKNPNPYLYTQIQYDPDGSFPTGGTAGECGFCQSVIQGDSSKEYTTRFFGKKVDSATSPLGSNFSTTHGLIHVSSLVDMGCSDRDYRSSGNGQTIWLGSFSQLDYFDYTSNSSLTVVSD